MEVEINKNNIYNKDISQQSTVVKMKIFEYFYLILNKKNKTSKFTLCFLHILEFIQIISFAFFSPHLKTWKISKKNMDILSIIISVFRIAPVINYTSYKVYKIILIILVFLIFCFFLILIMQILFRKEESKIYKGLLSLTHILIAPLTIFLYIPINEFLLLVFRCYNSDDVPEMAKTIKCWSGLHILYIILSIIAIVLLFLCLTFINFFYYYPFQTEQSTIKLNSNLDIILLCVKFGFLLRLNFINNEYISIIMLLLLSFTLSFQEIKNPTYNCNLLEIIIIIRNTLSLWTFFILFIAKIFEGTDIDGLIYLVFIGYPIVIVGSIMFTKEYENEFNFRNSNSFHNIKSCLSKTRILIMLINSFLDKNNINRKDLDYGNKNDLLLKGIIKMHTETCLDEECPLKKFMKNYGNFNVQKQCLLNYMAEYFNTAMKNFPYNKILRLYYIQFNFTKKYNLNSVRTNLEYIKKMKNNIKEEFIIYYLENEIIKVKNKILNSNDGNEFEHEYMILGQNYKRLKDLIIKSTKLYVEFWGTFSINITNNLNIFKLNKIGEQLNIYLNEINYLWENNLKNKKINIENEGVAQLYSKFLKEIIWDKKEGEEVQKKINEEYNIQEYKRSSTGDQKPNNITNIESMLENQDYVLFVNSNEKGRCNITQFSNSLSYLIGYQKQDLINKPIEYLMPSIFIEGHSKKVEDFIRITHLNRISKDSFREMDKKKSFILIKSKMGYLIPFNAKYTVFDDNDFSNSYLIKAHLEQRDPKSMYAYYILTKDDFSIDNISSSAINLGLTMDLLKKYVIKLDILIRTTKDTELNLFEKYKFFEEEPKKIKWIYPDKIYPKNDLLKNKDKKIEDLIKDSRKKKFNLQIFEMKYKEDEIIGFVFKFIEIQEKNKKKNEIMYQELIPMNKREIIFDLLNLNYIRTILVQSKTGLRNLRDKRLEKEMTDLRTRNKRTKEYFGIAETMNENSSEEEEKTIQIILTKDKILELQGKDSIGVKSFINLLPFYGKDITLIKHRPNKDEYFSGKTREPLIRIDVNNFVNRIQSRLKETPSAYRKFKNIKDEKRVSIIVNDNERMKSNFISSLDNDSENNKDKNEINKNLIGDSSITLSNIFNEKSIIHIKLINFFIYLFILLFIIVEFFLTNYYINNTKKKFHYLDNSHKTIVNLAYCKYFINEAIISNIIPNYLISQKIGKKKYITYLKSELGSYHKELSELLEPYLTGSISISKNIANYMSNKNISIKTLNNEFPKIEEEPLISALNRLSNSIFYVSTISNLDAINITDKYSYELMMNLLNGYYMACYEISNLIFKESQSNHSLILRHTIIIISFIISFISLFSFYRILQNYMYDIKKPINLFLTIKKQLFENLKCSAENFSNKLLNKFFGNEENEEESQQDYSTIIKPNDINIAKFKTAHEYKSSKKGYSIMIYFGQLFAMLFLFEIYNLIKYFYFWDFLLEVGKFNDIYTTTQISHEYLAIRINIMKQYFFNNSLAFFNQKENDINNTYYQSFHYLSFTFTQTILKTSKTDSFLQDEYLDLFQECFYKNFTNCIKNKNEIDDDNFLDKKLSGFKPIKIEVFEILRCLFIRFFSENQIKNNGISELINNERWYDLHELLINVIKPWYENIIEKMTSSLNAKFDNIVTVNISLFILMIVLNTLVYCIIWKSYEEKLHNFLKKSFDLINLIPKEIKYIIVSKLNE